MDKMNELIEQARSLGTTKKVVPFEQAQSLGATKKVVPYDIGDLMIDVIGLY